MKDKLISLDAFRKEVERNFDMQNLYLPVHILDVAEDAEEGIVRCKDCKHGDPCNGGEIYCEKDIGTIETAVHKPDWFCADGERKETT